MLELKAVNYNPDVLMCLANLSNDEVFTPPSVVNEMLDMLPVELWRDKNATFLDPVSKSGVFLREIAKRLLEGLKDEIPDLQERINHVLGKQIYGIAITELTALLSRRSVYCSKTANHKQYSVADIFETPEGNIHFAKIKHTWKNKKCVFCGASQEAYDGDDLKETHAYEFIHTQNPERIFNMKFDVIIGNPPYQLDDGGNGVSAKPIFHLFVQQAKKLNPRYLSMIIPARWYAGGKGLDDFRGEMLNDNRIKVLVDFESSKDLFEGVNIAGGICYFLWEKDYNGNCDVINVKPSGEQKSSRALNQFPVFIRANQSISIVNKVLSKASSTWDKHNYSRNPFGFSTTERGKPSEFKDSIPLLSSKGFGYVARSAVSKNEELIDKYKILIGRLVPSNGELDTNPADGYRVITNTRIIKPNEIHTESYLLIGAFKTLTEAKNFDGYIKSKFARFLLRQAISSLNVSKECFRFVPYEDFHEVWTDEKLYKKYGLDKDEISFIEGMIRPMDGDLVDAAENVGDDTDE